VTLAPAAHVTADGDVTTAAHVTTDGGGAAAWDAA
jgi:hypothetical protein